MASPAVPGLFFCFAAAVLLIFVSVSAPTWESISFLNVDTGGTELHFGVFGYTGTGTSIGYYFPSNLGQVVILPLISRVSDLNAVRTII